MHGKNDIHIKWPGEELFSYIDGSIIHGTIGTSLRIAKASGSRRGCVVGFVKAIRADNNNLEISSVTSGIGGSYSLKSRSPERTLVIGNTSWHLAITCRVQRWIAFNVDVETGAEIRSVTQL